MFHKHRKSDSALLVLSELTKIKTALGDRFSGIRLAKIESVPRAEEGVEIAQTQSSTRVRTSMKSCHSHAGKCTARQRGRTTC